MDAARWNRIQTLFDASLERPPDEREAFLQTACGDEPDLMAEVRSLLAADADAHPMLDSLALDALALPPDLLPDGILPAEGERVGAYRIVRSLGRGGMGAVFLAERADGQFEQRVALKLIRGGAASTQIVRRFQSERQILARLHHPHIARLLDGGITAEGQPWFAMEYVDGIPLDQYCEQHDCSIVERLQIMRTVCDAVQYAHRRLIVHRDLKPSNILVTADGTVKLLDFGIAKVLSGGERPSDSALTQTGRAVMTPAYAAPEQVQHAPVTTATDVYALGVVLYELLADRRPSDLTDCSPAEIERIVGTQSPESPSTVAPAARRRPLRGDLDTIVLKALRKEPERRYASAEQLSDDLRRHLDGHPVTARPAAVVYRTRKFLQRNRGAVGAAVAVVLLVASIVVVYTVQLAQERDRAQRETAKAEEVATFLQDIFAVSDPSESRGDTITARELLDRGAARIETELAGQPEVQTQMLLVTGEVYGSLGLYDDAEAQLNQALAARQSLHGERHIQVAEVHNALGVLHEQRGRYEEAAEAHRSALAIQRDAGAGGEPLLDVARSLHSLAHAQMRLGHYDEAERQIREALAIKRQQFGDTHLETAHSLNVLGDVLTHQRRFVEAEAIHRDVLAPRRRLLGDDHLDVAVSLHNLGALLTNQERYDEAEGLYREALQVWRTLYGDDHQEIANTLSQLAVAVGQQGRYAEAESMHREALAIGRHVLGDAHPRVAFNLARYARTLMENEQYTDAEATYREALSMLELQLGEAHPTVMTITARLGTVIWRQGRFEEAERLLSRSHDMLLDTHGPDDPRVRAAKARLDALTEATE